MLYYRDTGCLLVERRDGREIRKRRWLRQLQAQTLVNLKRVLSEKSRRLLDIRHDIQVLGVHSN